MNNVTNKNSNLYFLFEALNILDVGQILQAVKKNHALENVVQQTRQVDVRCPVILTHNDQCYAETTAEICHFSLRIGGSVELAQSLSVLYESSDWLFALLSKERIWTTVNLSNDLVTLTFTEAWMGVRTESL